MTFGLRRGGRDVEKLEQWILRDGYQLCTTCGFVLVNWMRVLRQHGIDGYKYWHISKYDCQSAISGSEVQWCGMCNERKSTEEFNMSAEGRKTVCRDCMQESGKKAKR